jgi:hypothetical protein
MLSKSCMLASYCNTCVFHRDTGLYTSIKQLCRIQVFKRNGKPIDKIMNYVPISPSTRCCLLYEKNLNRRMQVSMTYNASRESDRYTFLIMKAK